MQCMSMLLQTADAAPQTRTHTEAFIPLNWQRVLSNNLFFRRKENLLM